MTVFEYLTISISILLTLGVSRLITGAPYVFRSGGYWIHGLWFVLALLTLFLQWARIWSYHAIESWTLIQFFVTLSGPVAVYMTCHGLVSDNPKEVASWKDHFEANRKWIFGGLLVATVLSGVRERLLVGPEALDPSLFAFVPHAGLLLCMFSRWHWVQAVFAPAWLVTIVMAVAPVYVMEQ